MCFNEKFAINLIWRNHEYVYHIINKCGTSIFYLQVFSIFFWFFLIFPFIHPLYRLLCTMFNSWCTQKNVCLQRRHGPQSNLELLVSRNLILWHKISISYHCINGKSYSNIKFIQIIMRSEKHCLVSTYLRYRRQLSTESQTYNLIKCCKLYWEFWIRFHKTPPYQVPTFINDVQTFFKNLKVQAADIAQISKTIPLTRRNVDKTNPCYKEK